MRGLHAWALWGALAGALAGTATGCGVPSVDELAQKKARACSDERGCGAGYVCVAGLCEALEKCSAGDTRPCGLAVGECRQGQQACADGFWGACTGAVGPQPETCDGKDNDCDTRVDEWNPLSVSASPGVTSRRGAVRPLGNGRVLVMFEEGGRVVSRTVEPDDSLSEPVSPSITADLATRSESPALAADGTLIAAAWLEEIASMKRVMFATLDERGRSNLAAGGTDSIAVNVTQPLALTGLAIAVDAAARVVMVAVVDAGQLSVWRYSTTLPSPPLAQRRNLAANVRSASLSPAGGGAFWLSWVSTAGSGSRCLVRDTVVACAPDLATPALAMRGVGRLEGFAYASAADDAGFSVVGTFCSGDPRPDAGTPADAGLDGGELDAGQDDGGAPDAGGNADAGSPDAGSPDAGSGFDGGLADGGVLVCLAPQPINDIASPVRFEELSVSGPLGDEHLLLLVRALSGQPRVEWNRLQPAPARASGGVLELGVRPAGVILDARTAAVVYDSDESRLQENSGEVWLKRFCLP